jgi:hypothetical protein
MEQVYLVVKTGKHRGDGALFGERGNWNGKRFEHR